VFLALDATAFSQGNGFLVALALQFQQGAGVALLQAPGGVSDWTGIAGGIGNSGPGCDGNGNFECFQFAHSGTAPDNATKVPAPSIYDFEFAVTLPAGTQLSSSNDIKALYNTARDGSGNKLGDITSQTINIDSCTGNGCGSINPNGTVPEPGTMVTMLSGFGLLGVGAFRRIRRS
jgi:hypothetical protein